MMKFGDHRICSNCLKALQLSVYRKQHVRMKWTSTAVRQSFIDFFCQNHDHKVIKSSSIIPTKNQGTYFTNAGMNQFKPIFLDTIDKSHPMSELRRAVNSQKCVRVGGKHNDLEDVGKDLFHHTFFEMLGNWSFGDYFKMEACSMALELLTTVYKIPINRLYFTYFGGDEGQGLVADMETRNIWLSLGVSDDRVLPFGMKDNFWDMGDSGPCGPCTEIHYDYIGGPNSVKLVNTGLPEVLEIWNLVFMQYNRRTDGTLEPLNRVHVDTGMGLERMLAVMNNTSSTYNTDLFIPMFNAIQKSCNIRGYGGKTDDSIDTAYRIVADHTRMASVCIADGLLPGTKDQGHKLRSVLFRCFHQSKRMLQMPHGLVPSLVDVVVQSLGEAFPELQEHRLKIKDVISESEDHYEKVFTIGVKAFDKCLSSNKDTISRHLTDTILMDIVDGKYSDGYGIPSEMLPHLGEIYSVSLDIQGLHHIVEQHQSKEQVENPDKVYLSPETVKEIVGMGITPTDDSFKYTYQYNSKDDMYDFPQGMKAVVSTIVKDDHLFSEAVGKDEFGILLDKTIFYGECGGQVADKGCIKTNNGFFYVRDVQIFNKYVLHIGNMESGSISVGDSVFLHIYEDHRLGCMKNHTATHILNRCLRKIYDNVRQEGSRVSPHKFSFDFSTTSQMKQEDLTTLQDNVQQIINSGVIMCRGLQPLDKALQIPNIITMTDEEYPSHVYTVSIGRGASKFSTELCGGTHVTNTKDIESFCITSASMSPLGIKRMTCLSGTEAKQAIENGFILEKYLQEFEAMIKSEAQTDTWLDRVKHINKVLKDEAIPKTVHDDIRLRVDRLGDSMKAVLNTIKKKQLRQEIFEQLENTSSACCTVTTELVLTPQVIQQVLLDMNSSRPVAVVSTRDKNLSIVVCLNENIELDDGFETVLKSVDSDVKLKKKVKKNCSFLIITLKRKALEKSEAICEKLQSVFS
ncbi:alanine--tRNA ligase, cytoplasmic-like isoform X2 [Mytilus edulis]